MVRIYAGPATAIPSFSIEAFVIEQDRDLLLDLDPDSAEPRESLESLLLSASSAESAAPGSVLVSGGSPPYRFLAIVHDLETDPSWQEQWIADAFDAALREAEARGLTGLGLPLLGTVHGRLDRGRSVELLAESLARVTPATLQDIWLLTSLRDDPALFEPLREAGLEVTMPRPS